MINTATLETIQVDKYEAAAIIINAYRAGVVSEGLAAQSLGINKIEFRWLIEEADPAALRAIAYCERNRKTIKAMGLTVDDVIERFRKAPPPSASAIPKGAEHGYVHCPYCGGNDIDPRGWWRNDGVAGPACNRCGANTDPDVWNNRAAPNIDRLVKFMVDAVAELDLNATTDDLAEVYSAAYYTDGGTPVWLESKTRAFRALILAALAPPK